MAPIKKRASIRTRATRLPKPLPTRAPDDADPEAVAPSSEPVHDDDTDFAAFASSKKDRQRMKHSALLHKIQKSAPGTIKKRRRPNKKLVAGLEGLLGALPDVPEAQNPSGGHSVEEDEWQGLSDEDEVDTSALGQLTSMARVRRRQPAVVAAADGKMQLKTLKSRPGAMKRKAKLESTEMDRFKKNMAQMQQGAATQSGSSTADRWAALRGFIGQTMQQSEHFHGPKS